MRLSNWFLKRLESRTALSWKRILFMVFAVIGLLGSLFVIFLLAWDKVARREWEKTVDLRTVTTASRKNSILDLRLNAFLAGQEYQKGKMTRSASQLPSPSPSPYQIPESKELPIKKGKSPGIFFPYHDGTIINNTHPTIIAKISGNKQHLKPEIVHRTSVVTGKDGYVYRYSPGVARNVSVRLDGTQLSPVFAIAQYPEVECSSQACETLATGKYPDVLLFTKPNYEIRNGKHTLTITGFDSASSDQPEEYGEIIFYVYPDYEYGEQQIPYANNFSGQNAVFRSDICPQGWFYDASVLKIPIPQSRNKNLIYQISFPRKPEELNKNALAQIKFGTYSFDLFLPNYYDFYRTAVSDYELLFLPVNNLYYQSGEKIVLVQQAIEKMYYSNTNNEQEFRFKSFKIFTKALDGSSFENSVLPWSIGHDSSCDG